MKFKKIALAILLSAIGCFGVLAGCGEPEEHVHTYDWTETKAATCTEMGSRHGVCTICDEETDEDLPMLPHTWGEEVTEKTPSTCKTAGKGERTCEVCETTEEVALPLAPHTLTHHAAATPTCIQDGSVEYWSCSVCEKNFSDEAGRTELFETFVSATGEHIFGDDDMCIYGCGTKNPNATHTVHTPLIAHAEVPSTCAVAGTAAYWECEFCYKLFSSEEATDETEIPAPVVLPLSTEHPVDQINHFVAEAGSNCITAGNIEYWQCNVCENRFNNEDCNGNPLTDEEVYSGEFGLMHADPRVHSAQKANCRDKGYTIDCLECLACEKFFERGYSSTDGGLELEVFGPEDADDEGKVAGKEEGTYVVIYPITEEHRYEENPRLDENEEPVLDDDGNPIIDIIGGKTYYEETPATCDVRNPGHEAYWQCDYCYRRYKDEGLTQQWDNEDLYKDAAPHPADQLKYEEETDSTCVQHGHIAYYTCGVCGEHWLTDDTSGDPLGEVEYQKPYAAHEYTVLERNDVEHWYRCVNCSSTDAHDEHDFADEDAADKECAICGYTEKSLAPLFLTETKADGTLKIVGIDLDAYNSYVRENGAITVLRIPDVTPDGTITELENLFGYWNNSYYDTIQEVLIPASVTTVQDLFMGVNRTGNGDSIVSANKVKKVTFDRNSTTPVEFTKTQVKGWIEKGTFTFMTNLEEVVLPRVIKSFRTSMFYGCFSLTKITMPERVEEGGDLEQIFYGCRKMTSIDLTCLDTASTPYRLIGAFANCEALESVYLAKGQGLSLLASSYMSTFYGCQKLTDVYYTGSLLDWMRVDRSGAGGGAESSFDTAQIHYSGDWMA